MTRSLRLGALAPPGWRIRRSGFTWMCADGQPVRAGQPLACCNVGVTGESGSARGALPFSEERTDLHAILVSPVAGRLSIAPGTSRGGLLDALETLHPWDPDAVVGRIEVPHARAPASDAVPGLVFAAGRRFAAHAEVRASLLGGWYDRARAWRGDDLGATGTLVALGSCELTAALRGEQPAFLEFMSALPGSAQLVVWPDDLLVPCARVVREQLERGSAQNHAIAEDLASTFPLASAATTPQDWLFAATLVASLARSPLSERLPVLVRSALREVERADAVVTSLAAEPRFVYRHRRLGYTVAVHDYRVSAAGASVRAWLRGSFERVERDALAIAADLRALHERLRERGPARLLVLNTTSTSASEDVADYAQFDAPMGRTVESVRRKEANLALHDLARDDDFAIVDVDALAAEHGAGPHVPDGVHLSGPLQRAVRDEIRRLLAARGVPGFAPAGSPARPPRAGSPPGTATPAT